MGFPIVIGVSPRPSTISRKAESCQFEVTDLRCIIKIMGNEKNGILRSVKADVQAVADHLASGKPLGPEIVRRIRERSARIQQRIRRKYGLVDIAVPAIRELRGELPEP